MDFREVTAMNSCRSAVSVSPRSLAAAASASARTTLVSCSDIDIRAADSSEDRWWGAHDVSRS